MDKKILVVDDQFLFRQMLDMALSSSYIVENAEDGKIAIDKIESFQPDLIILDLMMPNIDGFTVLKQIQNKEKKPKVIILTAKHEQEDVTIAKELGADYYLTKPFEIEILENKIQELLK